METTLCFQPCDAIFIMCLDIDLFSLSTLIVYKLCMQTWQ